MSWDKDVASLLDDILQDKESEVNTPEEIANPVLDEDGDAPPVLVPAGTPGYFDSDCPECGKRQVCEHRSLSSAPTAITPTVGPFAPEGITLADVLGTDEPDEPDVTNLVTPAPESEDVAKAALPKIDQTAWSEPVDDDEHVPIPTFTDDDLMESIDIRNFGTLVSLTNRRWHAKIKDRKAAKDAAIASNADGEAYEARKRLLVGADEKLKAVHKHIDAARQDHYAMTLPWSTVGVNDIGKRAGPRLLPNTRFFDYVQTMGEHKAVMEAALEEFVDAYPTLIAIAQQKLGKAFNQADYPRPEVIKDHFSLEFDFDPIPTGGDYQGLQDAQVEKLAESLQKKTRQKLENALADAWQRVYDDVSHAARVLSNPDAMFHYTLLEKLTAHVANLKHLNVVNNAKIEEVRQDIHKAFAAHDVKGIRDDDALRKRLGQEAAAIQKKMEDYANEC